MGETYPDYLKVDFSKYTLLVRTYYDFKDYERREFPLTENREEKVIYFHMHTETKVLDNQTNNKDDLVFQVPYYIIYPYMILFYTLHTPLYFSHILSFPVKDVKVEA